jgi:hypothetical protein
MTDPHKAWRLWVGLMLFVIAIHACEAKQTLLRIEQKIEEGAVR